MLSWRIRPDKLPQSLQSVVAKVSWQISHQLARSLAHSLTHQNSSHPSLRNSSRTGMAWSRRTSRRTRGVRSSQQPHPRRWERRTCCCKPGRPHTCARDIRNGWHTHTHTHTHILPITHLKRTEHNPSTVRSTVGPQASPSLWKGSHRLRASALKQLLQYVPSEQSLALRHCVAAAPTARKNSTKAQIVIRMSLACGCLCVLGDSLVRILSPAPRSCQMENGRRARRGAHSSQRKCVRNVG